jgi:hypothetical protein
MLENEAFIDPLPTDGAAWLLKYIDQFHQAHMRSRAAAVYVMLQKLPDHSMSTLSRLKEDDVRQLLGHRKNDGPAPEFIFRRILVGALPAVCIGNIYINGKKAGQLPTGTSQFVMLPGMSDTVECTVGQEVTRPVGYDPHARYRTLNQFEYSGLYDHTLQNVFFSRSRLVLFTRRSGANLDTFIIPRTTIFKAFYACHTELANAFCRGPWSMTFSDVIMEIETTGSLKTEVDPTTGAWNIILRTLVQDEYAGLLAALYFDPYARATAESIHAMSMADRGGKPRAPWYASAKIPFQARFEPLMLNLKYLPLRVWRYRDEENTLCTARKFLVTDICGSTWPSHYPVVAHSRTNSGTRGREVEVVGLPPPFAGVRPAKDGDDQTVIRADIDANAESSTTFIPGNTWTWLDHGPVYKALEKDRSKRYEGTAPASEDEDEGAEVSPGARTREKDALPKGEVKTVVRSSNDRFAMIISALNTLVEEGFLGSLTVVRARRPAQAGERNGSACWKFIDEWSIQQKMPPGRGWRTVYDKPRDRRSAHWRCALILQVQFQNFRYHLIEIEAASTDTYVSLLLKVREPEKVEVIETVLDIIAEAEGRWLSERFSKFFPDDDVGFYCYQHHYNKDRNALTLSKVKDAFSTCAHRLKDKAN